MSLARILLVLSMFQAGCAMETTGEPSSTDVPRPGEIVSVPGEGARPGVRVTGAGAALPLGAGAATGATPTLAGQPSALTGAGAGGGGGGSGGPTPPPGASSNPNPSPWTDLTGLQIQSTGGTQ